METMISVAQALELINNNIACLKAINVKIENACGMILAQEVFAPINIPSFRQSSMDGYAFAFQNNRSEYNLIGEIAAGSHEIIDLKEGEAVRIFTGAALPSFADTVLMQEKAKVETNKLIILDENLEKGTNVRNVGSEVLEGEKVLSTNITLNPASIGLLASLGIAEVSVFPNPSVGIIITGNELALQSEKLKYGQIYDSNSYTLQAALGQINVNKVEIYRSKDNLDELVAQLQKCLEVHDLILISGGVSVGDYDFTSEAFVKCAVKTIFHKIKQKPGKPLLFGTKNNKVIFGLPGNPASVLTCFYEYVLPAISKLTQRNVQLKIKQLKLENSYKKAKGLTHFLKAVANQQSVRLLTGQESFKLSSFTAANCLAVIPEDRTEISAGELVEVHLINV